MFSFIIAKLVLKLVHNNNLIFEMVPRICQDIICIIILDNQELVVVLVILINSLLVINGVTTASMWMRRSGSLAVP